MSGSLEDGPTAASGEMFGDDAVVLTAADFSPV
jgi:hypothetical protein